jgi:hypothetical protein
MHAWWIALARRCGASRPGGRSTAQENLTMQTLLDPTNHYVFKRLFAEAPELLVALINDLRPDLPDIVSVDILSGAALRWEALDEDLFGPSGLTRASWTASVPPLH